MLVFWVSEVGTSNSSPALSYKLAWVFDCPPFLASLF